MDRLESRGLLTRTSQGYRILPDLLSDHLAFEACFDLAGNATQLVKRLMKSELSEIGPQLIRNLAEADWRASKKHEEAKHG